MLFTVISDITSLGEERQRYMYEQIVPQKRLDSFAPALSLAVWHCNMLESTCISVTLRACQGAELAKQRVHDMAAQKKKATVNIICCSSYLAAGCKVAADRCAFSFMSCFEHCKAMMVEDDQELDAAAPYRIVCEDPCKVFTLPMPLLMSPSPIAQKLKMAEVEVHSCDMCSFLNEPELRRGPSCVPGGCNALRSVWSARSRRPRLDRLRGRLVVGPKVCQGWSASVF